ncbi:hypothetical protein Desti_4455 [Desulfomonile tiedjei DSM 6799]|uniref:Uncharacterized protein n=1 Tax=Desulfomonile tiedjei (strain ATCC 49306 / DSM 6799 / DCB-1) TaxID=706587 RepID=I4CBZ6_DESTA|nr:hypothetical protein Desti_4455 [Desulfomonile tiedjei DSM 6799]
MNPADREDMAVRLIAKNSDVYLTLQFKISVETGVPAGPFY